jgi:hypothetical protein
MKNRGAFDEAEYQRQRRSEDSLPAEADPETLDLFDGPAAATTPLKPGQIRFLGNDGHWHIRGTGLVMDGLPPIEPSYFSGGPQKSDLPDPPTAPLSDGDRGSAGQARARNSDPDTSHRAAESISAEGIAASEEAVLRVLGWYDNDHLVIIDEDIVRVAKANGFDFTGSRLRSARADLVLRGWVTSAGEGKTARGRMATRWRITEAGLAALARYGRHP